MGNRWKGRAGLLGTYTLLIAGMVAIVPGLGESSDEPVEAGAVSPPFEQTGLIELKLDGSTTGVLYDADPGEQTLSTASGCKLVSPSSLSFLEFSSNTNKGVGLVGGSIGVKSKGNGENCGQVEPGEVLTVTLGTGIDSAQAAYRAELDIEVQQNAEVTVTASFDGAPVDQFTLTSGSGAPAGSTQTAESTTGSPDAGCNPQSSSGPNAADNDNCRWIIDSELLFDTLVFTVDAGKASLQGGGDGTPPAEEGSPAGSLLYLTTVFEGELDCGESTETEIGAGFEAVITRLDDDPGVTGAQCEKKPYNFQIDEDRVEFEPAGVDARYSGRLAKTVPAANPITVGLEYDPDGDGPEVFRDMEWCTDVEIMTTEPVAENNGLESQLVVDATVPDGESWCIAAIDIGEPTAEDTDPPPADEVTAVFWVYGEDDPHWR